MQSKILWFDLETTGIDPIVNGLTQFAGLVDIEGKIVDKFEIKIKIKPFRDEKLNKQALEKTKVTINDLRTFTPPLEAFVKIEEFFGKHINKFDKTDKFILAGKNIKGFDIPFLRSFFKKCKNDYFGSWFMSLPLDIDTTIAESIIFNDLRLENYQLETLCNFFDIKINAHDAMSDILATRELYMTLKGITT